MLRRQFVRSLAGMTLASNFGRLEVLAQPSSVVRIVNGFPAGGVVDIVSRRIAEALPGPGFSASVIVDNKVGAAGRIACAAVKSAPADGNTLLLSPDTVMSLYPFVYSKLEYDPFKDFIPVSTGALTTDALAVGPMVPDSVRSLRDFFSWAKSHTSQANFGSPGSGSPLHLLGALLAAESAVPLNHVPYRGAAPGVADVLGGQIAAMIAPTGNFLSGYRAGKLRILATSSMKRSPFTPDVPTFAEQKFAGDYPATEQSFGFFVASGTSSSVVNQINTAITRAISQKSVVDSLSVFGMVAKSSTSSEMITTLKDQHEKWGTIVRQLGFKAETA